MSDATPTTTSPSANFIGEGFEMIDEELAFLIDCFHEVLDRLGEGEIAKSLPWQKGHSNSSNDNEQQPKTSNSMGQAYSIAFQLLNIVEERVASRVRRKRVLSGGPTFERGSWSEALSTMLESGSDEDQIIAALKKTQVEPVLTAHWMDPSFDSKQRAFYYARVLENPTCRWSQHLCVAAGVRCDEPETIGSGYEPCCAASHQPTIQERAWTSPIWYTPR